MDDAFVGNMRRRFTRARVLKWLAIIVGAAFLVSGLVIAILYPVKGIPLYGKFLLGAVFFAGVVYSFYLEEKGDPVVPRNRGPDPEGTGDSAP
jgi:hypothetical protein